jgi:3-deoxy-D-manno-octulosonic-acid transferase
LIMETELWFNLIAACKQRNIPILLLNARLSEKSASGYAKLGKLASEGLQNLSAVAAQTNDDAARLQGLGAKNLSVAGNFKFDVKPPADIADKGLQLRKLLGKKPIFLAASTRDGEEALILDAVKDLDILTVIVPRHPQRFDEVAAILEQEKVSYIRKTLLKDTALQANIHEGSSPAVILGDTMGELFTYYAACDFTFIGGSLLNYGGQNLIEAAAMGKPIIIGEHTFNFAEATNNAVAAGAAIRIKDVSELRTSIILLRDDLAQRQKMQQAALRFSESSTGATARMMKLIAEFLPSK